MIIIEKDFKIEHNGDCFVLYFLKSKKELKENSEDLYKVHGYYLVLSSAIKAVITWRKDKKYPFNESYDELLKVYLNYKKSIKDFNLYCNVIYEPITILKHKVFNEYREFQNRH